MIRSLACIEALALKALLERDSGVLVLDVRSPAEYAAGHITGARNLPLDRLPEALGELARGRPIVTVCGKGGGRSEAAAALLRENGFEPVRSLCGGMTAWDKPT